MRARALAALGAPSAQIVAAYGRVLELDGAHVDAMLELAQHHAGLGRRAESLALYARATRADPDDVRAAWEAVELLRADSGADPVEIERRLEALLARDPLHSRAAIVLAGMLSRQGKDLQRADALARRSLRLRETPLALGALAGIRMQLGAPDQALSLADRGLVALPDSAPLHYQRGLALIALERPEDARAALERALAGRDFKDSEAARQALARLPGGPE